VRLTSTGRVVLVPEQGFRARDLRPSDPYWSQWVQFRALRRRALVTTVLFPIAVLLVFPATVVLLEVVAEFLGLAKEGSTLPAWIITVLFGAMVAPWLREAVATPCSWRCPRCELPFLTPESFGTPQVRGSHASGVNPFWPMVQLCVNCGLAKWTPRNPDNRGESRGVVQQGVGPEKPQL